MSACRIGGVALSLLLASEVAAQAVRVSAFGAAVNNAQATHSVVDFFGQESLIGPEADGFGAGVGGELEWRRFRFQLSAVRASLSAPPVPPILPSLEYNLTYVEGSAMFFVAPFFGLYAGFGQQFVSPEREVRDVSWMSLGVHFEAALAGVARTWALLGALPWTTSEAAIGDTGYHLGLGVAVGVRHARLQGFADFQLRQIGALAGDESDQFSVARLGLSFRP